MTWVVVVITPISGGPTGALFGECVFEEGCVEEQVRTDEQCTLVGNRGNVDIT